MAGEDRGEVLTNLEEVFGTVVEHEVIKMVLQSCGWDSSSASEVLLAMIDKNDLPDHALDLLEGESSAQGGGLRESCGESGDSRSLRANGDNNCDKPGMVDGSPRTTLGAESESSSPSCSPLRSAALSQNVDRDHDSSQWVLAPEFVPNAFYQNPSSNNGIWPLGMSRSLAQAPQFSVKSRGEAVRAGKKKKKKDEIVRKILMDVRILVLMRGLPGSGKSMLAKEVKGRTGMILSADDYFRDKRGKYNYDPSKLGDAHQWTRHRAVQRLKQGKTPIIIDNTNLEVWEMKPYIKLALQFGYEVDILEPDTPWKLNPKELAKKNIHGVPKSKIAEMKSRYNQGINIERLVADLQGIQLNKQNSEDNEVWGPGPDPEEVCDKEPQINDHIPAQQETTPLPRLEGNLGDDLFWSSDEDDDADVIIEGYQSEDDEADDVGSTSEATEDNIKTDSCAEIEILHINEKSKDQDENVEGAMNKIDVDKTEGEDRACQEVFNIAEQENENEGKSHNTEDQEEPCNCKDKPEDTFEVEGTDVSEKEKIEILKESCNDTDDAQIETEWDQFTSQVSWEEEITDQKFNDLVMSFECAMKEQLQKKIIGSNMGTGTGMATSDNKESLDEDSIMYELCSNMEEQTGKSFSVFATGSRENEEPNSFLMVDHNQECRRVLINNSDVSSSTEAVLEIKVNRCDGSADIVEGMIGNQNASDNLENLLDNNHVPSGSCVARADGIIPENSPASPSKINDIICSSDTDIQKESHDVPSDAWKDFAENESKSCGENKILTSTNDTGFSSDDIPITLVEQDRNEPEMSFKMTVEDPPQDVSDQFVADSLTSWECIDTTGGESYLDWDSAGKEVSNSNLSSSRPTRTRRKRTEGDPTKWLKYVDEKSDISEDPNIASWNPVQSGLPSWDTNESEVLPNTVSQLKTEIKGKECSIAIEPQPHTGAVRKFKRQKQHIQTPSTTSSSSGHSDDQLVHDTSSYFLPDSEMNLLNDEAINDLELIDAETQTRSIDFEALQQGNSLLEMKIIYSQPDYIPQDISDAILPENGPLTMGKLRLDKGTMTDGALDVTLVGPFRNLVAFFPKISEEDLKDVFEKCNYNLNWAMNVLLDGGYEMSDPVDVNISCEEPRDVDIDTESTVETTSTGDGRDDRSSFADASDISSDMLIEERTRKFKQSQQQKDLDCKKALENSFNFSNSVDDRVTRLTGKDFGDLSMTKIKRMKNKKKHGGKKNAEVENVKSAENKKTDEDGGGAQYITLVMDPLFASQLNSMFGPVGSCEISGDLTVEDRSVILPLEFCHMIHKYWADTLDGKFKHETEVLDSLIREDESFARRLQEEEEDACSSNGNKKDNVDQAFQVDPPHGLREIMDLEQALQESQGDQTFTNLTLSSRLSLQRLQAEYPEVDPVALKEEFAGSGFSYKDTAEILCSRYRTEQGIPKTVIAPEAFYRYEQQLIKQAQQISLAQQEEEEEEELLALQESEEIVPDDPQVYRDEAHLHYRQRQEAFKKAQEASSQGMKAVAAYYARIGNEHSIKLNEANHRASKKILEATNANVKDANCLDLHHLHATEALSAAQAFLIERQRVITARGLKHLKVSLITGRGAHSLGGQARLKPTIQEFLRKSGYIFYESNRGMFTVTLQGEQV